MRSRPLVSIVTPTLNQGAFIEHALQSVRNQTYPSVEHLVIDGGSTDGTLEILRRRGESDGLRWTSEPDNGMYDAINKGLSLARGTILAYLNSDDAYLPWAVETALAVFEARPEVDVVYGDGVRIDDASGTQRLRLIPPLDRTGLAFVGSLVQPAVFWRRSLLERVGGFDDRLRYVGDLDFWLRAADSGLIVRVDEVLCAFRAHEDSLSTSQRDAMAIEDGRTRAAHGGDGGTVEGRRGLARAVRRKRMWQRRLWARFALASLQAGASGPWPRFRADGRLSVSIPRILLGQLPGVGRRLLPNAVASRLADEVLRGPT